MYLVVLELYNYSDSQIKVLKWLESLNDFILHLSTNH